MLSTVNGDNPRSELTHCKASPPQLLLKLALERLPFNYIINAMDISRGFRRLSVLAALMGLTALSFELEVPTTIASSGSTVAFVLWMALFFAGLPALFVLLIGWVIEGFRKAN